MKRDELNDFFNPRSIAVVGASDNPVSVGCGVMRNILANGFRGRVYPINIKRKKVWGINAHSSVLDVDKEISLVIVATPAETVKNILYECGEKRIRSVVIMSSGFSERGEEGKRKFAEIARAARDQKIRLLGPNCMGFIKPNMKLNATFASEMPADGELALVSQSGALGSALISMAKKKNLGLSFFASLGAMEDIGFADLIDFLDSDDKTKAIILYMESLTNASHFIEACKRTVNKKPIFALKVGKSEGGASAALSHTGSLVGNNLAFEAAFEKAGVISVEDTRELIECARVYLMQGRPKNKKVAVITNAGGPGVITSDFINKTGGELAKISKKMSEELGKTLPKNWSHGNPIDLLGDAEPEMYKKAIETCLKEDEIGSIIIILTPQSMTDPTKAAQEIIKIKNLNRKVVLASWIGGEDIERGRKILENGGIPVFDFPEEAAKFLMKVYRTGNMGTERKHLEADNNAQKKCKKILEKAKADGRMILNQKEAAEILEVYGIKSVKSEIAHSVAEAGVFAKKIGFPIAMKISSPDIIHKKKAGGVELNIGSENEAKDAYGRIIKKANRISAKIEGVVVEKMVSGNHEAIIGSKKDEIFGKTVLFGAGGSNVELMGDIAVAVPPLTLEETEVLMKKTKFYSIIKKSEGNEGLEKMKNALYNFSRMVNELEEIKEIDVNPYIFDGKNGAAVDIKIILEKVSRPS